MSVVTFRDYIPTPRADGIPWSKARIEESLTEIGPWVQIDLLTFNDPDNDPNEPRPRSFTTHNATLESGWYLVTFLDDVGNAQPTFPIQHPAQPIAPWAPDVAAVARHISSRTRDEFGNVIGTFSSATMPKDYQVLDIINDAVRFLQDKVGDDLPEALWDNAARVAAIRAAMQIELDFFSDQVNTGRSIYPQLEEMLKQETVDLASSIVSANENDGVPVITTPGGSPHYSFPTVPPVGMNTRF